MMFGVRDRIKLRILRHGRTAKITNTEDKHKRRLLKFFSIIKWYICHPGYIVDPGLYYSCVEISVTTNCTLKCKKCVHFIPRFGTTAYTPAEVIIEDLRKLLEGVKHIDEFRVLGGEPLLHPELHKIVAFLLSSKKITLVEIVTNGTIAPSKEIINLFPNDRLNIHVSNYGKLSTHKGDFTKLKNANVTIAPEDKFWYDHGDMEYQNRSIKELKKQFSRCDKQRCVVLEGKLHNCCIAAYGFELGVIALKENEYINLRDSKDAEALRRQLRTFKKRKYHVSCNYCYDGTDLYKPINVAEQLQ